MKQVTVPAKKCPGCGHVWVPRGKTGPRRCPKCWKVVL